MPSDPNLKPCIAELLGPLAQQPGWLGCQCADCKSETRDAKRAAANDREDDE